MNRHTTPPQVNPPYTNGHYETPLNVSGVSLPPPIPARQPTVFPPDLPLRGLGAWFYALHHFQLGGLPLARMIALLWIALALLGALNLVPGHWLIMAVALLLWIGQITVGLRYRRQHYVTFTAAPTPALNETPLDPSEKLPIYATGCFNVEGRYQEFSALPGFYRTFATGEHALLCRLVNRTWLALLNWPPEEAGMWYIFVHPNDIQSLTWGQLAFGASVIFAIAVEYRLEIPPGPRRKKAEIRKERIYIAAPQLDDAKRIYVDLLNNLPASTVFASQTISQS